jgi:hypothetical protein
MNNPQPSERFKTLLSILIALTAVTAAIVAWQASRIGLKAASADGKALAAAMDGAATDLGIASVVFNNQVGVRDFAMHRENARSLNEEYKRNPDAPASWLDEWQSEMIRARASHSLLAPDFIINKDGRPAFDEALYRDRARAEAAAIKAIDPAPFLAEASRHRRKGRQLVGLTILFTLAIFLFTVALKTEVRGKTLWTAAGGSLYATATVLASVWIFL